MNWKTRQMFSDQEHGIVSGLSPVNMTGGGNVPYPSSYQDGGTVPEEISIEQRVAALAAQQGISVPEARAMILTQMIQERGVTLPDEVINQFATGVITLQDALSQAVNVGSGEEASYEAPSWKEIWERDISNPAYDNNPVTDKLRYPLSAVSTPVQKGLLETFELLGIDPENAPKMQTGGLALDLFERGDQDINEVLNTSVDRMSGSVNPPLSDVGPTEKVEETVTVTEDQGPSTMDGSLQKLPFQQMAIKIVEQADEILKQEDYMNIEEVEQQVQQELTAIDEQYRLQTGATDSILTEEFLTLLDRITTNTQDEFDTAPGMAEGTPPGDIEDMELEAFIRSLGGGASADPDEVKRIIKAYLGSASSSSDLQAKKQALARRSALLAGKTKQGGWAGMMDILGQADAAEAAALGDLPRQLSANEAALERLAMEIETSLYGGTKGTGMTADAKNLLILKEIMAMPDSPQKQMMMERFNIGTKESFIREQIGLISRSLLGKTGGELNKLKKILKLESDATLADIAFAQAKAMADKIYGTDTEDTEETDRNGNESV